MGVAQRPLSPHLGIYRWKLTMALSIFHRMTGVFLSLGAAALVIVLASLASGAEPFSNIINLLQHPIGQVLLFAWTVSLYLHMANGVRHLFWDMGVGFDKSITSKSGIMVVLFAIFATVATWLCAWTA